MITAEHMARMKHQAIVGNIGHFDNEIDMAGLARTPGIERIDIKPQVDEWVFPDGHSVIVLSEGRLLNLGNATGHPSFVMSNSFTNQVIAQIELFGHTDIYEKRVYTLPKHLDEKVARLHLDALGVEADRADARAGRLLGVPVDGPVQARPLPLLAPAAGDDGDPRCAVTRHVAMARMRRLPPHDVADLGARAERRRADRVGGRADAGARADPRAVRRRAAARRDPGRRRACTSPRRRRNLLLALTAGGAEVALCSANPLSTQDDVAAALVVEHGVEVRALPRRGPRRPTPRHVRALLDGEPQVTIDDGADLLMTAHALGGETLDGLIGGTEETTTGLVRLRRLEARGQAGAARCSRSTRRAPSGRSTTATAPGSRRSTGSSAPATCCSPATRSWSSATAGPARGSPSGPAAPAPP